MRRLSKKVKHLEALNRVIKTKIVDKTYIDTRSIVVFKMKRKVMNVIETKMVNDLYTLLTLNICGNLNRELNKKWTR
jgi:hypothetical protein